ncbi:hypothetical protein KDW80_28035 [Burkholderia vietnamiensis]|nr:hypothetical protein [Burkholderia vietnamiensis]MBR8206416.1 hypothetical protein [Burkholderia vietnamiensis]HDR8960561.1 hypothetical protein [Burkholderia vietnamiensis]HDR9257723.1 hypothetical protein [Burkholderia vietnamiensis]
MAGSAGAAFAADDAGASVGATAWAKVTVAGVGTAAIAVAAAGSAAAAAGEVPASMAPGSDAAVSVGSAAPTGAAVDVAIVAAGIGLVGDEVAGAGVPVYDWACCAGVDAITRSGAAASSGAWETVKDDVGAAA